MRKYGGRRYGRRRIYRRRGKLPGYKLVRRVGRRGVKNYRYGQRDNRFGRKWTGRTAVGKINFTVAGTATGVNWTSRVGVHTIQDRIDPGAPGVKIVTGFLSDAYITQLKTWYKYVKILSVTYRFKWNQWTSPSGTTQTDRNTRFWWRGIRKPAAEVSDTTNTMNEAIQQQYRNMKIRHGQEWAITFKPVIRVAREIRAMDNLDSSLLLDKKQFFWTHPGWIDMAEAGTNWSNSAATTVTHCGIWYGFSDLQEKDVINVDVVCHYALKGHTVLTTLDENGDPADEEEPENFDPEEEQMLEEPKAEPLTEDDKLVLGISSDQAQTMEGIEESKTV